MPLDLLQVSRKKILDRFQSHIFFYFLLKICPCFDSFRRGHVIDFKKSYYCYRLSNRSLVEVFLGGVSFLIGCAHVRHLWSIGAYICHLKHFQLHLCFCCFCTLPPLEIPSLLDLVLYALEGTTLNSIKHHVRNPTTSFRRVNSFNPHRNSWSCYCFCFS